jgi:prepilin peptidase CpaA
VVGFAVALAILLIIYNTIRLTVMTRRREVEIMIRLGASDRVIATPFALEAQGQTLTSALAGLTAGFLMMLPGHLFGATGAGDVKLFAAAGTLLGVGRIIPAFLCVAIAGGVFAVLIAWQRGRLSRTMKLAAGLCGRPDEGKTAIESPAEHNRFPYGPAIAVGCVVTTLTR